MTEEVQQYTPVFTLKNTDDSFVLAYDDAIGDDVFSAYGIGELLSVKYEGFELEFTGIIQEFPLVGCRARIKLDHNALDIVLIGGEKFAEVYNRSEADQS